MIWFSETAKAYTNAIGIEIPEQGFSLGRFVFGPEVAFTMALADRSVLEPFIGLKGVWDFARTKGATAAGVPVGGAGIHGRIEAGFSFAIPDGVKLRASGSYDGVGASTGLRAVQGRAQLVVPLQ